MNGSNYMDAALQLRIDTDRGMKFSDTQMLQILGQSELVRELTSNFPEKPLALVWRLICLSEIPFSNLLDYTQKLIDKVYKNLATPFGFSLSGDEKHFLPCYNAMVVSALCRLGRAKDEQVQNALNWIDCYQPMERGMEVSIPNFRFDRFGGCFNKTPCYIGLAKSVIALQTYQNVTNDFSYRSKLREGTEYMLQHRLFKRMGNDKPITPHILDISFPESYHLNAVELIRFAGNAGILNDNRTHDLIDYLKSKQAKDGSWKISFRYKADGYMIFDKVRGRNEWVTYIIKASLGKG